MLHNVQTKRQISMYAFSIDNKQSYLIDVYNMERLQTTDRVARVLDAHFQQVDEVGGLFQAKHIHI